MCLVAKPLAKGMRIIAPLISHLKPHLSTILKTAKAQPAFMLLMSGDKVSPREGER